MASQKLGPFNLVRVVGRGGMGTVYEAIEIETGKTVAVKVLAPAYSFDDLFRHRFEGEIEALLKLNHPNIVRLLSYGQDEGSLFFAMELIHGNTLYEEQKKGHVFHWSEIVDIAIQVCSGLRHAHDRGIIHRDLKPGNLMLNQDRVIKITDFGIAKSFGKSSLTGVGNVLGTMDYMAPEQARGQPATARSDLFSLGAVMYSLLAGRPPFLRETSEETFDALLSSKPPVPLNQTAADVPLPLAKLIHRLLNKDADHRIATAHATERQLAHVRDEISCSAIPDTHIVAATGEPSEIVVGDSASSTFLVTSGPGGDGDQVVEGVGAVSGSGDVAAEPVDEQTAVKSQKEILAAKLSDRPNYYNEITPQQRIENLARTTSTATNERVWPIALAFLLVLGVAGFGIWYAIIRVPSADTLLNDINAVANSPTKAREQIEKFLANYQDHDEFEYVQQLSQYADAIRHRNVLDTKASRDERSVSKVALDFLEATDLKNVDPPLLVDRMELFFALHGDEKLDSNISDQDRRTIEMAQVYFNVIKQRADDVIEYRIDDIQFELSRGRAQTNVARAKTIFQNIIDEYDVDSTPAIQKLVDEAKRELNQILSTSDK